MAAKMADALSKIDIFTQHAILKFKFMFTGRFY